MHVNTETVVMAGVVTVCLRKEDPKDASSAVTHTLTRTLMGPDFAQHAASS